MRKGLAHCLHHGDLKLLRYSVAGDVADLDGDVDVSLVILVLFFPRDFSGGWCA